MIKHWMTELAAHYEEAKRKYPDAKHMIMFDIDGTILDMRFMVLYLLKRYDRLHKTNYFSSLTVDDINVPEDRIWPVLNTFKVPPEVQEKLLTWYEDTAWTTKAILEAHRPLSGVLEVIRWFQMQPNTDVGLNTARLDTLRKDTLRSLNQLGQEYKVKFDDELLYMKPPDDTDASQVAQDENALASKALGARYFQNLGYRIFAFIDNEPENLNAVAQIDEDQEILLLHAETIFRTKRSKLPIHAVVGTEYDLAELMPEDTLPGHIQFVWQGIDDLDTLNRFVASDVHWGEFDVRLDPTCKNLILRHDAFQQTPIGVNEWFLTLEEALDRLGEANKGIKLDLKAGGQMISKVIELADTFGFGEAELWFSGDIDYLHERDFRELAAACPHAIIQCPVDFLVPLTCEQPDKGKEILDQLSSWGINRLSVRWDTQNLRVFFDLMDKWGFDLNVYNVLGLEAFLRAILLSPTSIVSDFDFPRWGVPQL